MVLDKFLNHTWYLNQIYVPLSLFSNKVSTETKAELAKKLIRIKSKPAKQYQKGYPTPVPLPKDKTEGLDVKLSDFVGKESLFMFDVLNFGKRWLKNHPSTWHTDSEYREMQSFVQNLRVVNDCAERGVKLIGDYAQILTKDAEQRQFLLQVVEEDRKLVPNTSKSTLAKCFDQRKSH